MSDPPGDDFSRLGRTVLDLYNRGDLEGFVALCAPDVSFNALFDGVDRVEYRGHEGVRAWWRDAREAFEGLELVPDEISGSPGRITITGAGRARGRGSGVAVEWPVAAVVTVRENLIAAWTVRPSLEEALEEASRNS